MKKNYRRLIMDLKDTHTLLKNTRQFGKYTPLSEINNYCGDL